MRRLSKKFGQKYNFKRLLQTTPNLSKLYNQHEDAVNSIEPIKHVTILQRTELMACDPNAVVDINAACAIEIYGPGQKSWPCRIKYAEQILDVRKHGYSAWVVKIRQLGAKDATVDVLQYASPYVILHYPVSGPADTHAIYNPNKLARIDEEPFVTYFLTGKNCDEPIDLMTCSIIPDQVLYTYNSTFYDREVAHLYAESLQVKVDKWYAQWYAQRPHLQ